MSTMSSTHATHAAPPRMLKAVSGIGVGLGVETYKSLEKYAYSPKAVAFDVNTLSFVTECHRIDADQ